MLSTIFFFLISPGTVSQIVCSNIYEHFGFKVNWHKVHIYISSVHVVVSGWPFVVIVLETWSSYTKSSSHYGKDSYYNTTDRNISNQTLKKVIYTVFYSHIYVSWRGILGNRYHFAKIHSSENLRNQFQKNKMKVYQHNLSLTGKNS